MKILLTGQSGQLGHVLAQDLLSIGQVICPSRADMDLAQPDQIRKTIRAIQPDLIVNPAAYTAVDKAEQDIEAATRINTDAPMILAQEASLLGVGLVHFSTDYVFDGTKPVPYTELDAPCPGNVYGQTKLAGEQAIAQHIEAYWIFRTSWVYGTHGGNFLKTIMRLAQERESLQVVADQIGAPTWTKTLSQALLACLRQRPADLSMAAYLKQSSGLYHLSAQGETSWHAYARHIVQKLASSGIKTRLTPQAISEVTTANYPTAARRPANSRLDTAKIRQRFHVELPLWNTAVDECLARLLAMRATTTP